MRAVALLAAAVLLHPAAAAAAGIEAHVTRSAFAVGETSTLEVEVRDAAGRIHDPELGLPPGLEVLGSGRSTSLSWVNGRSRSVTVFRFEIGAREPGTHVVGPVRVRVGNQTYESPPVTLTVTTGSAPLGVPGGGEGPASLLVDVTPAEPWVGQPVLLRVRLVQRAALAEDPQYTPPSTPGFWSERFRDPESYYADEGHRRVLVTETRARLYPLNAGRLTIGEATAVLALPTGAPALDPLRWLGGAVPRREVTVRSRPREVRVRALPAGAPAGFGGAVGQLEAAWSADRARTAQDVPFTVRLEVRGRGNLPLIRTPGFDAPGLEVFPAAVEDSLGAAGELAAGRRRFEWTVLARAPGTLTVPAPALAWFDPAAGRYVAADTAPIAIEVGPPLFQGGASAESFPLELDPGTLDPGARGAEPLAWAVAGLMLGAALALARASAAPPPDAAERARQREWLRAVGLARGRDFWQAADGAIGWLAARGAPVAALRRDVDAARFGAGGGSEPAALRPRIVEQLGRALPPPAPRWPLRVAAAALGAGGVVLAVLFAPRAGAPAADLAAARAADALARAGEVDRARAGWQALWDRGHRAPGLAARLGWAAVREGEVGPAAAWTLRGERVESRHPALGWVRERVREAGGLIGAASARIPVRRLEWAVAALLAGAAAGWWWPRRAGLALAALAALLGAARDLETAWIERTPRAVVVAATPLEGPGLQLEPGQVVRERQRAGAAVRVRVAGDLEGTVPAAALEPVAEGR